MLVSPHSIKSHPVAHMLYDTVKTVALTAAAEVALRVMQQPGLTKIGIGTTALLQGSFWLLKSAVCSRAPMSSSKTLAAVATAMIASGLGLIYSGAKECVMHPEVQDPIQTTLARANVMIIIMI